MWIDGPLAGVQGQACVLASALYRRWVGFKMDLPFWRDVALILLIAEAFLLCLPALIALYFAIRGLARLQVNAWLFLHAAQEKAKRAEGVVERASGVLVAPLIGGLALWAGLCGAVRSLLASKGDESKC